MTSIATDTCSICGELLSAGLRHCPTCKADAGAPNVRACRAKENLKALLARFQNSQAKASAAGCSGEFSSLEAAIKEKSSVVISVPAGLARKLLEDPSLLYLNYEQLVGSDLRTPASPESDRLRCAVGGILFGSYASSIVYGSLSLSGEGLPTYGDVHCRIRPIAIDKRTSFLETNSYKFVQDHRLAAGSKLPLGFTASWEHRHFLVLAKLGHRIAIGQTELDWQQMLAYSDGLSRANDDFVEAHVFEGFDRRAIESLTPARGKKLTRDEKLDLDIAVEKFKSSVKGNTR